MTLAEKTRAAMPYHDPKTAWQRSVNWCVCHWPLAVYIFAIAPLLVLLYLAVR